MKPTSHPLFNLLFGSLIGLVCNAHANTVVPVTGVTGHDGGNFAPTLGHLTDMINGANPSLSGTLDPNPGMTVNAPSDPSTWTYAGNNWQQEWLANSLLNPATSANAKVGWVVFNLGSPVTSLGNMYLWNNNNTNPGEHTNTYNVYYATTPVATLPAMPNSKAITGDYNFASGGWTLLNTGGPLTLPRNNADGVGPQGTVALGGISAQYIGIEILTAGGAVNRAGLAQVEFTQTVADTAPPTLVGIADNKSGGPVDVNTVVTYTVTFNEDINSSTVTAADFDNAGTSAISIGTIAETTPGVFTIQVTPTSVGTLRLRIPLGASITDVAGNPLDNDPALLDDSTLTVNADSTAPTLTAIVDDQSGGPIATNTVVIYTVSFSEDINAATVSAADFSNAGSSTISIGPIAETSPGVFTIQITPTTEGTLQLQVPTTASITDTAGNPLVNNPAILDNTIITVQVGTPSSLVQIASITGSHGGDSYANGMVSLINGSGITKSNPGDPSTWTFSGNIYNDEWMATYLKVGANITPGLNGKVAWASLDFGSKKGLGMLYLFNNNYASSTSGTDQFNLYYADSPTVALPAQPAKGAYSTTGLTPQADYNFSGGGWTLLNTGGPLSASKSGISSHNLPGVSARYLAIEILSNHGDATGGGRVGFDEIAVTAALPDTDGDGLPDDYELANTDPSSATALDPAVDYEPDGLTTWQEYVIGTNPKNPDTDGDTLNDGPETVGVGSRPPTNPLLADSDGDTLSDLAESNTGVWGGISNPGTDPTKADTDTDGLSDNVETNTGIYVSIADTGTNPHNANSDGDNADDWYEVAIIDKNPALGSPPNSPNDPALQPNIPYPLPDPDASTGATNKPVKVYIMSGQSNMVGFGQLAGTGPGTLQTMTGRQNKFPNLVTSSGAWTTRNDVKYRGVVSDIGNGNLRPDVAGGDFGPELGFGYVMGWYHNEPVLLIKSCVGNRSLLWDYAPPTTPPYNHTDGRTYAGYGQAPNSWLTATEGPYPYPWYAGKQFDDCFKKESDMSQLTWGPGIEYQIYGNLGSQVRHNGVEYMCSAAHTSSAATEPGVGADWATAWKVFSINNAADVLDSFASDYPAWASQGFEIAGYVWWQGYNDRSEPAASLYRENMARFIQQLRSYYDNRYPNKGAATAPFVLATLATNGGWSNTEVVSAKVAQAQLDVVNDVPNVKTVEARGFWRDISESPGTQGFHYNWNAETYLLVGDALGRAMVDMQGAVTPPVSAYDDWADNYPALTDTNPVLDFDGGSLPTGIEWVVGGNPSIGSDDAGLAPTINTTTDPNGKLLFSFRRTAAAKNDATTIIAVQYGSNLAGWTDAVHQGTGPGQITITATPDGPDEIVTAALPPSLAGAGKLFVRLNVAVATE